MTYTIKQLTRVHVTVQDDALKPSTTEKLTEARRQRVNVMDQVMAQMLVYGKRTMDRDELEPNVVIMIDHLLSLPHMASL